MDSTPRSPLAGSPAVPDPADLTGLGRRAVERLGAGPAKAMDAMALAAVISAITGVGVALSLSLPLLSVVLDGRGISPVWVGINTATAGVAAITILPFVSELAKRFGVARTMTTAFVTMAAMLMGFYLIEPFVLWFPMRFVFSASVTLIFAMTEFWISSLAPPHRRGLIVGVYTAFLSIGISIGPLILALVGTEGILPFLIGALCILLAAVPVVLVRGQEPELPSTGGRNLLRFVVAAPLALFAALVFGAVESGGTAILPLYGTAIGLSSGHAVILVSAIAAGNVLSQIPIGYLADRVNRRLLLIGSAAVGVVGAALIPFAAGNYALLLALLFITGGIVTGLYTIGLTQLGARYSGGDLASANAAFVMMYAFGMLIGPVSLGAGLDLFPPHGFAVAIAVIFGTYVLMALLRIGRKGLGS
ncbi:MFS transporter [Acuticoccus sp. M5D2P5]|uniref:MFS transporter n=1 Tax=Acuticoccus kalidii TaxID=2910977 RepID=UPI001F2A16F0|nr:MFS transporter [Acuticoccus kalidii]MCF3935519.1 MFS transporter [Acuticoccus kalidii]